MIILAGAGAGTALVLRAGSGHAPAGLLTIAPFAVAATVAVNLGLALLGRRPARLAHDGADRFVALPRPWAPALTCAVNLLAIGVIGATALAMFDPLDHRPGAQRPVVGVVLAMIAGVALFGVLSTRPGANRVVLDREGLLLCFTLGRAEVPWSAVTGVTTPLRSPRPAVAISDPGLVRRHGMVRRSRRHVALPAGLRIDHRFLVTVIDHYARHPEDRGEIGTSAGHDRLVRQA